MGQASTCTAAHHASYDRYDFQDQAGQVSEMTLEEAKQFCDSQTGTTELIKNFQVCSTVAGSGTTDHGHQTFARCAELCRTTAGCEVFSMQKTITNHATCTDTLPHCAGHMANGGCSAANHDHTSWRTRCISTCGYCNDARYTPCADTFSGCSSHMANGGCSAANRDHHTHWRPGCVKTCGYCDNETYNPRYSGRTHPRSDTATWAYKLAGEHPATGYCRTTSGICDASNPKCGKVLPNDVGVTLVGKEQQYHLKGGTAAVRRLGVSWHTLAVGLRAPLS
jgi:hypothetical protein